MRSGSDYFLSRNQPLGRQFLRVLLALLLLFWWPAVGQEMPDQELFPLDDSVSTLLESIEIYGMPDAGPAVRKVSLRAKMPPVGHMGKAASGQTLGWAIAYYAGTMTLGLKPSDALSPHFLFDMLTKDSKTCRLPASRYMLELKQVLLREGCLRKADYQVTLGCGGRPGAELLRGRDRYRLILNKLLEVPPAKDVKEDMLYAIRRKLNAGQPVVGIMKADQAFRTLKSEVWQPVNVSAQKLYTHALVIVGYDDAKQEIEVVNCWGKEWGNGGYGRISYRDLYYFRQLFQLSKPAEPVLAVSSRKPVKTPGTNRTTGKPVGDTVPGVENRPDVVARPPAGPVPPIGESASRLAGKVQLRIPAAIDEKGNIQFEDIPYHYREGAFQSVRTAQWPLDQQFQLVLSRLSPGTYLYLFSVDARGAARIHWPQKSSLGSLVSLPYSSLVPDGQTMFLLPRPRMEIEDGEIVWKERVFTKEVAGTDFLVVLHSVRELSDEEVLKLVGRMAGRQSLAEFRMGLYAMLGERLISDSKLWATDSRMEYEAGGSQGEILPLILTIE